jgi:hypothetical protein
MTGEAVLHLLELPWPETGLQNAHDFKGLGISRSERAQEPKLFYPTDSGVDLSDVADLVIRFA